MLHLIHNLLQLFIYVIIADIILSYVPNVREQEWAKWVHKIADVPQRPIREFFQERFRDLPLDPAPMIVIILIQMLMYIL